MTSLNWIRILLCGLVTGVMWNLLSLAESSEVCIDLAELRLHSCIARSTRPGSEG